MIILLAALCEGLSSTVLLWQTLSFSPTVAERSHTQYDAELGWVNIPDIFIKDMYGPGLDLQTNGQGFRNNDDFTKIVPPGKLRVICSGDSFTLGYGVANEQTWCQSLATLDVRLQPVNMGQGGYGLDQAYLWYKRDGAKLDHDIQLFAFISIDFERMQQQEFLGYGKPLLTLNETGLAVKNVPVPRRAFYIPWLTQNSRAIQQLKSVQLFRQLFQNEAAAKATSTTEQPRSEQIAAAILKDLLRLNRAKESTLVLIYLPTLGDYEAAAESSTEVWRQFLQVAAKDTGVAFIDGIEAFRTLPPAEVQTLFIPAGTLDFPAAAGHYSVKGNEFVARLVYDRLLALPTVAARLEAAGE